MKYFKGALGFWLCSIAVAFTFFGGVKAAILVTILSMLEVSLSFDNAIVNAAYLEKMDDKWKKWFITWGMVIAVFGMRLAFPVAIVALAANLGPWAAMKLAVLDPVQYATILTGAHVSVAGFGMAFLAMVFFKFFFDKEKDVHWVGFLESKLHYLEATEVAFTLAVVFLVSTFLPSTKAVDFILAGMAGLALYVVADWLGGLFEASEGATIGMAKLGLGGAIYLELQDASFSFDGVIGAFSITDDIFIITMGLGVGAFAIRGLTLMLVDKGTLSEYRYLEHGAFYAIGALAAMMGIGTFHEIPDVVTGLIGASFIALAFISSIFYNRNNKENEATNVIGSN